MDRCGLAVPDRECGSKIVDRASELRIFQISRPPDFASLPQVREHAVSLRYEHWGWFTFVAGDNQTIIKERFYLNKTDPNILHNQMTVIDNALTRPWTVTKNYRRDGDPQPVWIEWVCAEGQSHVRVGKEN
jgi:hypothetical protein